MVYKISTTTGKHSVPEKLYILGQLAEGLLTDAQAIDKYQLSPKLDQSKSSKFLIFN